MFDEGIFEIVVSNSSVLSGSKLTILYIESSFIYFFVITGGFSLGLVGFDSTFDGGVVSALLGVGSDIFLASVN